MSSRVFVVHQPVRWAVFRKCMEPLDLSSAEKFGKLQFVFPGTDRPPAIQDGLPQMKKIMSTFTDCDYLALVGNMDLMVWAAALAFKALDGGPITLLRWNGRMQAYEAFKAPTNLFA